MQVIIDINEKDFKKISSTAIDLCIEHCEREVEDYRKEFTKTMSLRAPLHSMCALTIAEGYEEIIVWLNELQKIQDGGYKNE